MKSILLIVVYISFLCAGELKLNISGVKSDRGGEILIFLYQEENWMKIDSAAISVPLSHGRSEYNVVLNEMNEGKYAIRVIHDEDGDGKLNMKWFPPGPLRGTVFRRGIDLEEFQNTKKRSFIFPERVIW